MRLAGPRLSPPALAPAPARPLPLLAVFALLALLDLLNPVRALAAKGYVLEEEIVKGGDVRAEKQTTRTWLVPEKMRKEESGSGTVTIVRDDRKLLWVVNGKEATYFELTKDAMDKMGQMGMAILLQGKDEDPSSWVRKTGNKKKVGSWEAYEVRVEDKPLPGTRISIWLSPDVPIDRSFRDRFSSDLLAGSNPAARFLQGLRGLEGYPVEVELTYRIGSQTLEMRQVLKKVEAVEVADDRFELPAGLKKVPSPFDMLAGEPTPPAER